MFQKSRLPNPATYQAVLYAVYELSEDYEELADSMVAYANDCMWICDMQDTQTKRDESFIVMNRHMSLLTEMFMLGLDIEIIEMSDKYRNEQGMMAGCFFRTNDMDSLILTTSEGKAYEFKTGLHKPYELVGTNPKNYIAMAEDPVFMPLYRKIIEEQQWKA